MTQWTLDAALLTLSALTQNTPWYQPLDEMRTEALRANAAYIRDFVDGIPNPGMDDLALMSCMDALLDWLVEPQDENRINRLRRTNEIYGDTYDLIDEQ